jgi:ECF transporter S component (folate family)
MMTGILLGPVAGALTGIASDLLGMLVRAQGAYFPGFTLSYALVGLIPGLMFYKAKKVNFVRLLVTILVVEVFISLVLNTFWLNIIIGKAFIALLPSRALARVIIAPIEIFVIHSFFKYDEFKKRLTGQG